VYGSSNRSRPIGVEHRFILPIASNRRLPNSYYPVYLHGQCDQVASSGPL